MMPLLFSCRPPKLQARGRPILKKSLESKRTTSKPTYFFISSDTVDTLHSPMLPSNVTIAWVITVWTSQLDFEDDALLESRAWSFQQEQSSFLHCLEQDFALRVDKLQMECEEPEKIAWELKWGCYHSPLNLIFTPRKKGGWIKLSKSLHW